MEEVLIPLIVFSSIFGMVYVYLNTRNKERLSLIEKGRSRGQEFSWDKTAEVIWTVIQEELEK